ncbi:hypothetical protein M422DRAFT_275584 [Sphaerobolus stellatus SS14]|uniref:Uncharacterized protein n=1 Tax=Sphaerobolus stellatus (strain SS14) TaxID=990650 RepID=A0A0C9T4G6_SPHS4|nr:hypothetical protein M422DRAFT_275584 [Sphaerobolus stellatus SS14]
MSVKQAPVGVLPKKIRLVDETGISQVHHAPVTPLSVKPSLLVMSSASSTPRSISSPISVTSSKEEFPIVIIPSVREDIDTIILATLSTTDSDMSAPTASPDDSRLMVVIIPSSQGDLQAVILTTPLTMDINMSTPTTSLWFKKR